MVTGYTITKDASISSKISDTAGIIFGLLLPSGALNNHSELIAPVASALAGSLLKSTPGMIGGAMAGVADEGLLGLGFTNKHYLTFSTIGAAAVNLLGLKVVRQSLILLVWL